MKEDQDYYYRVMEKIGEGTYGTVHRGVDQRTGTLVALKRVKIRKTDDGLPKEFLREVESLKHLSNDNIVKIREVFVGKTNINIVYEYMDTDLAKVMEGMTRPFSLREVRLMRIKRFVGESDHGHGSQGAAGGS